MRNRRRVRALFLASPVLTFTVLTFTVLTFAVLTLAGCGSSTTVDSIAVSPASVSVVAGATAQLTALGSVGHGSHPASSTNVTATATWASSATSVATVSSTGVVTGVGAGTATITASMSGFGGLITSNSVAVTVTGGGSGGTSSTLASLSIIPSAQSVSSPNQTSQFIAIATTSSGATEDVTAQAVWSSSSTQIAKISSTGLATGLSQGTTTITAIVSNPGGSVVTGTATFTVIGGLAEPYTAITINPGFESLSATGQIGQFTAIATLGSSGLSQDVTNSAQVTWTSGIPSIATVSTYPTTPASSAGQVAGVSPGSTTITAKLTNPDGTVLTSTATVTITASSAAEPLLSITILPSSITIGNLQGTGQFLAYGTFSTPPTVMDITNGIYRPDFPSPSPVNWVSGLQTIFPITSSGSPNNPAPPGPTGTDGGLITAYASGSTDVYAVASNPDGTVVYSPAVTFNCPLVEPTASNVGSCNPETIADPLLVTLTVFNAGLDQTNWLVTAPSATGTPNVIHCGPGSNAAGLGNSVCTATYPINTPVLLTAPTGTGQFGGWSYNCAPALAVNATGPNSCMVTVGDDTAAHPNSNVSVGAIFN